MAFNIPWRSLVYLRASKILHENKIVTFKPGFSRSDWACKDGCGLDTVDVELYSIYILILQKFGYAEITSACRCAKHNKKVGGRPKSKHLLGKAMDIKVANPKAVYDFLNYLYPDSLGLGLYHNRIHVDVRPIRARW